VAIYSTELIKQQRSSTALELFIKYGAPAKPQNFNIYRHLASEIGLRNIFLHLVKKHPKFYFFYNSEKSSFSFVQVKEVTSPTIKMEFGRFLRLFHYMVISKVCQNIGGLEVVATKASVSLLRYADSNTDLYYV
jgi:intraflagellar transport protein 172